MFLLLWVLVLLVAHLINLSSEWLLQHVAGLVLPFHCLPFVAQPSLCFLFLWSLPATIIFPCVGRVFSLLLWSFGCHLVSPLCLPSDHLVDSVHCLQGSAASPCLFIIALWICGTTRTVSSGTIFFCSFFAAFGAVFQQAFCFFSW